MKKVNEELRKILDNAPEYSMEELEQLSKSKAKEEEDMIEISEIPDEKKSPNLGWFFGYIAGILTVVIACGLTHNKKWKRL